MKNEVYNLVPQWAKEDGDYCLMIGDDIDSLATSAVIQKVKGYEVNWFYDFHKVYTADKESKQERIGCDMALEKGKVIDNHVTLMRAGDYKNPESVNLNVMYDVSRENYGQKYAGSTLLLAWSLYGLPLPETNEGKLLLMAVDSAYLGHYNKNFKYIHNNWFKKLGFEELIYTLDWTDEDEFKDIFEEYNLNGKIKMKNGQLQTSIDLESVGRHLGIDVELPIKEFELIKELNRGNMKLHEFDGSQTMKKSKKVYSFALTYKNLASYTML